MRENRRRSALGSKKGFGTAMAENRAFLEIMERLEQELNDGVRAGNRVRTAAQGRRGRAVAATATNQTPMILTIGAYVGAACTAVWVSLNLLHWFWRQLQ
jgi:hypothetical protein